MSAYDHVSTIVPLQIWTGVLGSPVQGDQLTLTLIELDPGSVVPEHAHPNEQIGILLRGSLRFRIGGEERELERGGTWCIRAHVPHDVVTGPEGATLIEAFAPVRADWAALEQLEPSAPPAF
jgi:quercetin dioxygenase-like cupin family protein